MLPISNKAQGFFFLLDSFWFSQNVWKKVIPSPEKKDTLSLRKLYGPLINIKLQCMMVLDRPAQMLNSWS